ncbi:hypothetical protein D3C85_1549490 [compost metagenome]
MQQQAAVAALFAADADGLGAAFDGERSQGVFGVLLGEDADALAVLAACQFVQARAQRGVGPPAPQRNAQAQIDRIGQRVGRLASEVLGGGVEGGIHEGDLPALRARG